MKCTAPTASGNPCAFDGGERGLCLQHDPDRADERRVQATKASAAAVKALREQQRQPRTDQPALRSTDDLLTELELALKDANTITDAAQRCKSVVSIVSEARATLKASELETENKELRALLLEKHPSLAGALKVVK